MEKIVQKTEKIKETAEKSKQEGRTERIVKKFAKQKKGAYNFMLLVI